MRDSNQLSIDASGAAKVQGPLTLDTVADVYRQANAEAGQGRRIAKVDLGAVSRVDSSGLALLLEWQALSDRNGHTLHIHNAPEDLLSLAGLCEASGLLEIEGRDDSGTAQQRSQHSAPDAGS